jgi:quercetin dioxygenase-like cupin family protein
MGARPFPQAEPAGSADPSEVSMKIIRFRQITPRNFENEEMRGVAGRVLVGKREGAPNFIMRLFEVAPGGHTPKHTHDWEHELFVHSGKGEIFSEGTWHPLASEDAVFVPAKEEHQIRNSGAEKLVFLCLIPARAPEL